MNENPIGFDLAVWFLGSRLDLVFMDCTSSGSSELGGDFQKNGLFPKKPSGVEGFSFRMLCVGPGACGSGGRWEPEAPGGEPGVCHVFWLLPRFFFCFFRCFPIFSCIGWQKRHPIIVSRGGSGLDPDPGSGPGPLRCSNKWSWP